MKHITETFICTIYYYYTYYCDLQTHYITAHYESIYSLTGDLYNLSFFQNSIKSIKSK